MSGLEHINIKLTMITNHKDRPMYFVSTFDVILIPSKQIACQDESLTVSTMHWTPFWRAVETATEPFHPVLNPEN